MKKIILAFTLSFLPLFSVVAQTAPNDSTLLSPETGVDYRKLEELLAKQNWRQANEETKNLMLQAAGRQSQGWLTIDNVRSFACWDLDTINRLWMEYSQGRFGFTPQFQIFVETGNRPGRLVAIENYQNFGDRVGWRENDDWIIFIGGLDFSLDAPIGHLPNPRDEYQIAGSRLQYTYLAQRLIDCKVVASPSQK